MLDGMNRPVEAFTIVGNLHYVGASDLTAYLITTPEGHILLDGGLAETAPLIMEGVRRLGYRMEDVHVLLNSHAHLDHAAGLAALKEAAGARLVVSEADASLVERGGRGDDLLADSAVFPTVRVDERFADGFTLRLGGAEMTAHLTPGHTRGCTTWTMTVEEAGRRYHVVFVCSVTVLPGVRFLDDPTYPGIVEDYARAFQILEALPVDIFLASHGSFFGLAEKMEALREHPARNPFVDPERYRRYVARGKETYLSRLEAEKGVGEQSAEERIAFYSDRDGNFEIYSIRPDGSDLRRLTFDPAPDQTPAWAPDGHRLAFSSKRTGNGDIYVMDADGGNLRRITAGPGEDSQPAWSPDGTRIAFSSLRDGNRDIYVVDEDGGNEVRLTTQQGEDGFPQWSPDGRMMLSYGMSGDRYALFLMNQDGSNRHVIAHSELDMVFGRWSPDGTRIAFFRVDRESRLAGLSLIDADGMNEVALTPLDGRDEDPSWSPDGRELVFHAFNRDANWNLYIVTIESGAVRPLFTEPSSEYWPVWSPAGRRR
jgi:metallo-beta-lactamase class B